MRFLRMKMLARPLLHNLKRLSCSRMFSQPAAALPLNTSSEAAPLPTEPRTVSPRISSLVEEIANLSLLEVTDLNWALKKRLNLPDAPVMGGGMFVASAAPAAAAATANADAPEAETDAPQKITFAVKLTKFDTAKKIALIKEIKNIMPDLNLVQAKKFVETAPCTVKEDMGKAEAEELKALLEKAGASCEIA